MTDFDYENLQKKRIAQGAFHKKGGSKSRKCTMPSDYLTPAQKKALNGPVTTILLNQPMDWETYKSLSETLQKTYLTNLKNTYNPNTSMLARMFGVTPNPVTAQLRKHGLPVGLKGAKPSKERQAMWEAFCNGVVGGGNNQSAEEPKKDEPQVTCYDIEAEELERAKLAALAESVVQAEEEIAAAEGAHSVRTEVEELNQALDKIYADLEDERHRCYAEEKQAFFKSLRSADEKMADKVQAEEEALADAIIEALEEACDKEATRPKGTAKLSKMQVNLSGDYRDVADQINDLLFMFGGKVRVRMEIIAEETE